MTAPRPVDLENFFCVRSWLAVMTEDPGEVAQLLGAADARPCTFADWASRPQAAGDEFFVCEPVDGWTLVFGETIGLGIPQTVRARRFDEVHAFHLDDKRSNFYCERAIGGSTVREITEADGQYSAEGKPDPGEPELPSQADSVEPTADDQRGGLLLSQEKVLRIAEAWGADPMQMVGRVQAGLWCRTTPAEVQTTAVDRRPQRSLAIVVGLALTAIGLALALALR